MNSGLNSMLATPTEHKPLSYVCHDCVIMHGKVVFWFVLFLTCTS